MSEPKPYGGILNTGASPATQELVWLSPAKSYLERVNQAQQTLSEECVRTMAEITRQIPDCPQVFTMALSGFPDLAKIFISTHNTLRQHNKGRSSFHNQTYRQGNKEVVPDDTDGFTGYYVEDVLEAIYFLFGIRSQSEYKAQIGAAKLLASVKKPENRTPDEQRYLSYVKQPQVIKLIAEIHRLMLDKDDASLLEAYSKEENPERMKLIVQKIREKYPLQENALEGLGVG